MGSFYSSIRLRRSGAVIVSVLTAMLFLLLAVQTLRAQVIEVATPEPLPPELTQSTKSVDQEEVLAGETLAYTIVVSNSGTSPVTAVLTDSLPAELRYVTGTLTASGGLFGESGGIITWTGSVNNSFSVEITFDAIVNPDVVGDTVLTNTAVITGAGSLVTMTAATTVVSPTQGSLIAYLPIMKKAPPIPVEPTPLATRPDSGNNWTVYWSETSQYVTGFELQEAQEATFANPTTYNAGMNMGVAINHPASPDNEYFYRVRAIGPWGNGPWSDVISVVGTYFDDFSNSDSGWAVRRTTYLKEIRTWYENEYLVVQVEDSWDWGIFSPLKKAPSLPYAIEYRSEIANTGNLVSHGAVFGGDWTGEPCPDYSTLEGLYEHDICFNHFYNTNTIFYGPLKVLFERVDYLVWCPTCGGSPMKRLAKDGDVLVFLRDPVSQAQPLDWNTWRIEVRETGITFFVNGSQYAQTSDTALIHDPYFGVFASADEYSNSTWRIDDFTVTPLDQ